MIKPKLSQRIIVYCKGELARNAHEVFMILGKLCKFFMTVYYIRELQVKYKIKKFQT